MAARKYKRRSKVYSTKVLTPLKNKWVFSKGRISKIGIATLIFDNKVRGANYVSKQITIDTRGPVQMVYYTSGGQMKIYDVKRTEKLLSSLRKYKNRLT